MNERKPFLKGFFDAFGGWSKGSRRAEIPKMKAAVPRPITITVEEANRRLDEAGLSWEEKRQREQRAAFRPLAELLVTKLEGAGNHDVKVEAVTNILMSLGKQIVGMTITSSEFDTRLRELEKRMDRRTDTVIKMLAQDGNSRLRINF